MPQQIFRSDSGACKLKRLPWMEAIFHYFLPIFPPLVTIIKYINLAPCLETEPGFSKLPPHFHLALVR